MKLSQTHKVYNTFNEVKDHFYENPEFYNEENAIICRVDPEDQSLGHEFDGCHVFVAINWATGWDLDVPRAVLDKRKCSMQDDDEIQQMEYVWYDGEPEEPDIPEEPSDPYPCDVAGPGPNDIVN